MDRTKEISVIESDYVCLSNKSLTGVSTILLTVIQKTLFSAPDSHGDV